MNGRRETAILLSAIIGRQLNLAKLLFELRRGQPHYLFELARKVGKTAVMHFDGEP